MKYIKIFEDFFKYFRYSGIPNKQMWGYNREDIEDLFLEITDEWQLPISIDFTVSDIIDGNISGETIRTDSFTMEDYIQDRIRPKITVQVFTNSKFNTSIIGEEIDFPIFTKGGEHHTDLSKRFLKGLTEAAIRIRSKLESITKTGRIEGYDIDIRQNLNISNKYGFTDNDVEYGVAFLFVTMDRKKFSELSK